MSDHRYLYAVLDSDDAGHAHVTLFVADFDRFVTDVAQRGLHPDCRETYDNGVRKAIYRDPDGNEIGVGGGPAG